MSWLDATWRGLLVVVYFVIFTVWLPHRVMLLGAVQDASPVVRDLVLTIVWGGALAGGMFLMRLAQRRGFI